MRACTCNNSGVCKAKVSSVSMDGGFVGLEVVMEEGSPFNN